MVKICDVVNGCEDCPKYGDDCDGDKMTEHTDLISRADAIEVLNKLSTEGGNDAKMLFMDAKEWLSALPSADAVPLKQTDTLIIADALQYLAKDAERHLSDRTRADALRQQFLNYGARMKGGAE